MSPVKHIHQVFIQDNGRLPPSFPESISENTACVRRLYPDAEYRIYSGNDIRDFIIKAYCTDLVNFLRGISSGQHGVTAQTASEQGTSAGIAATWPGGA